jgi:hypothetical protein
MDEVYTMGGDGVGKCESPRVPVSHTRTMHLTSQHAGTEWVLCFSISSSQRTMDHRKWAARTEHVHWLGSDSPMRAIWRATFGAGGVKPTKQLKVAGDLSTTITASFPPRDESCRWAGLCSSLLKLILGLELRGAQFFFQNFKTQIQKIWKIKSRCRFVVLYQHRDLTPEWLITKMSKSHRIWRIKFMYHSLL